MSSLVCVLTSIRCIMRSKQSFTAQGAVRLLHDLAALQVTQSGLLSCPSNRKRSRCACSWYPTSYIGVCFELVQALGRDLGDAAAGAVQKFETLSQAANILGPWLFPCIPWLFLSSLLGFSLLCSRCSCLCTRGIE
jgi:hypothetical protein